MADPMDFQKSAMALLRQTHFGMIMRAKYERKESEVYAGLNSYANAADRSVRAQTWSEAADVLSDAIRIIEKGKQS